jgi:hypothetical protein
MRDWITQDLRYAVRSLRAAPSFTAGVVVTLAFGIGANAAIFGIVDAVLLRMVPVTRPRELYFLAHGTGETPSLSSTYPLFSRYRSMTDVFSGVTAYNVQEFRVSTDAGLEPVIGQFVAGNYHQVLSWAFRSFWAADSLLKRISPFDLRPRLAPLGPIPRHALGDGLARRGGHTARAIARLLDRSPQRSPPFRQGKLGKRALDCDDFRPELFQRRFSAGSSQLTKPLRTQPSSCHRLTLASSCGDEIAHRARQSPRPAMTAAGETPPRSAPSAV